MAVMVVAAAILARYSSNMQTMYAPPIIRPHINIYADQIYQQFLHFGRQSTKKQLNMNSGQSSVDLHLDRGQGVVSQNKVRLVSKRGWSLKQLFETGFEMGFDRAFESGMSNHSASISTSDMYPP